tara:strand:- start:883 stop:1170 length:288 start_codon:yes stop_codon:yes gene_type:complete
MIASEIKDLKAGEIVNLASNVRSIMLEVALDGATNIQLQISHDKTTWHNFGAVIDADGLLAYSDKDEHFLQYVKVVVTGTMGANGKLNLYFGRSK